MMEMLIERLRRNRRSGSPLAICVLLLFLSFSAPRTAEANVTLVVRDSEIREVFEMIARSEEVSIALGEQVAGKVSISLFDVERDEAIRSIAQAAGFGVEQRGDAYLIVDLDEVGRTLAEGATAVRAFKVQYSDPETVREILVKHLSRYGQITSLPERRLVVVEDLPDFLDRVGQILDEIDQQPKQILLEAKVLEVGLDKNDTFGIDWSRVSQVNGAEVNVGLRGLTSGTAPGLFFNLLSDNLEGSIEALSDDGRVRALAAPRLLTMENQEAEVLVGSRLGFRVTTTINQVTTESVEFIESGVILRFTPSVDRDGRILLSIHPEVSLGKVNDGIPEETTTEVTTQLLVNDGERIFIGGLIRDTATEGRRGIPLLSRIPVLGLLFARSEWNYSSTETIVIVKATVQDDPRHAAIDPQMEQLDRYEPKLHEFRRDMEDDLDQPWSRATDDPAPPAAPGPSRRSPSAAPAFPIEAPAANTSSFHDRRFFGPREPRRAAP